MSEEIGKTIKVKQRKEVEVTEDATHFNILQVLIQPPQHLIQIEICLKDAEGNAVGKARWLRINPLVTEQGEPPEITETDNWGNLINMSLKELNAKVKARLVEGALDDGV